MTGRTLRRCLLAYVAAALCLSGRAAAGPAMDAAIADSWSFAHSRLSGTIGYIEANCGGPVRAGPRSLLARHG